MEQRFGCFQRRWLARTHDTIDIDQCFIPAGVLINCQRVADVWSNVDVIDCQCVDLVNTGFGQHLKCLFNDLVTGFNVNFTRFNIDDVVRDVATNQLFISNKLLFHAFFAKLT